MLNYDALRASATETDPFPYSVTPHLISPQAVANAIRDFPNIDMGGLFLPKMASHGRSLALLIEELQGPEVRRLIGKKLDIDLAGRPTMVTLRANCQARDGRIHADAKFKVATLMLYLNDDWADTEGGKLRVLRSGTDIEDYAAEVAPKGGLAVCFRVQPNSWHGHKPFVGPRRYVMLNYCVDIEWRDREVARHHWSNQVKKFARLFGFGQIEQKKKAA